jgi:hypothetical protein
MQTFIDEQTENNGNVADLQPESPETAARGAHNEQVLAKIETSLAELEASIAKLGSLAAEQTRLASEIQKTASAEAELLRDESLSESAATKELIKIRALADVLRARAKAAELSLSLARSFAEVLHA